MRPQLLKVSKEPRHSFSVRQDLVPYVNNRWHYHLEVELIHFKKGEGTQFIGDNIKHFKSGDVVLVGSSLPHYWRFDDGYFEENRKTGADVRVAHFCEDFWGNQFLQLPENLNLKVVLERAKRGLQVTGKTKQKVAEILEDLLHIDGTQRIMLLIEALQTIADCKHLATLSSIGFKHDFVEAENDRVNAIYDFSLKNFKRTIQLEEIASVANISPNSFCRYFKSRTRKTYSQFLIEIRVGHACKLLIENNLSIKQLCYESGFNNFTSFHKYFKIITGKSPLNYQKEFIAK
ncbi:MAG: helix-turn-helix transcriptional regulator [Sediminibacterium sp.]